MGIAREIRFAKWIVGHWHDLAWAPLDHACIECVSDGCMIIPGFKCAYHESKTLLDEYYKDTIEAKIPDIVSEATSAEEEDLDSEENRIGHGQARPIHLAHTPPQCTCGAKKGEWHKQECAVNTPPPEQSPGVPKGRPPTKSPPRSMHDAVYHEGRTDESSEEKENTP